FSKKTYGIPARKSIYSDPELKNDPYLGPFILEIRGQNVPIALPLQSQVYEPMGVCLKKVLNGDLVPEYALKDLEASLKQLH
ncbi:hypothetical protein HYY75_09695, partial [bacterium]|nr:hypothetical protein [bacterium]